MSLFLSVGELSGDRYGAAFLDALRRFGYRGSVEGMAGPHSSAQGCVPRWSYEELQIMGFSAAIRALPRLFRLLETMVRHIVRTNPRVVVLVDSPDFHLPLARKLRQRGYGGALLNIAPPTIWAWRYRRVKTLRRCFDRCFPLLPFEHALLRSEGVSSRFCGHPLLEDPFFGCFPKSPEVPPRSVALLPGSRRSEVTALLPVLQEAVPLLEARGMRPWISVAPELQKDLKELLRKTFAPEYCAEEPGRELLARTDMALGASGTVSVEALLLRRYMVVLYRLSRVNWSIISLLRKLGVMRLSSVSLPNLLEDGPIYPELLQKDLRAVSAVSLLESYRTEEVLRGRINRRMEKLREKMGNPGAYSLWARSALEYLG